MAVVVVLGSVLDGGTTVVDVDVVVVEVVVVAVVVVAVVVVVAAVVVVVGMVVVVVDVVVVVVVVVGGVVAQSMVPTNGKLWTSPPLVPATPWWCSAVTTAPSMFAELKSISVVEGA